jgi:hypothetical protein
VDEEHRPDFVTWLWVNESVLVRVWLCSDKQFCCAVKIWCSQLDTEMGAPATTVQGLEEKRTEKLKRFEKIGQFARNSKYARYKSGCLC